MKYVVMLIGVMSMCVGCSTSTPKSAYIMEKESESESESEPTVTKQIFLIFRESDETVVSSIAENGLQARVLSTVSSSPLLCGLCGGVAAAALQLLAIPVISALSVSQDGGPVGLRTAWSGVAATSLLVATSMQAAGYSGLGSLVGSLTATAGGAVLGYIDPVTHPLSSMLWAKGAGIIGGKISTALQHN